MASQILVTDATSFVSTHIIKQLQAEGHQVRATVTSLQDQDEGVKKLLEEVNTEEVKFKVEVVEADPAKADSWETAMKDIQFVIHGIKPAAEVPAAAEGESPVQPAVEGITNVFKACVSATSVRRVIVTSSYRAIIPPPATAVASKTYSEEDWAEADSAEPLIKSVILAEKAAWDFVKELTDADKIELVVINPTQIVGPAVLDVQEDIVKSLMDGSIKATARVHYELVDVRDVATAHVKALTNADVAGQRVLVHGNSLFLDEMAKCLSTEFKPQGYHVPYVRLPKSCLWGLSLFNKHAKSILPLINKTRTYSNAKMTEKLSIEAKDVKESVVEEAQVLVDRGLVKKSKKAKNNSGAAAKGASNEGEEVAEVKEEEAGKSNGDAVAEEKKEEEIKGDGDSKPEADEKKEEVKEETKKEEETAEEKKDGAGDAPAEAEENKEVKAEEVKLEEKTEESSVDAAPASTGETKTEE